MSEEDTLKQDPNNYATEDQMKYRFSASRYSFRSPAGVIQTNIVPQSPGNYAYPQGDATNIPTTNIDFNHATNAD